MVKESHKHVIQWIFAFVSLFSGIALYTASVFIGRVEIPSPPDRKLELYVYKPHRNNSNYLNGIKNDINSAKSDIYIISRQLNTTDPNFHFIKALNDAMNRNVNIKLIMTKHTKNDTDFFRHPRLQFKNIHNSTQFDYIVTDMLVIDQKKLLLMSNFVTLTDFNKTQQIAFKVTDGKTVHDAAHFFELAWARMDFELNQTIPPQSRFWDSKFIAMTKNTSVDTLSNGDIYIASPVSLASAPGRTDTKSAAWNLLGAAKDEIYISSAYFDLPNNFFVQNSLINAAYKNTKIKILLSHNSQLNMSLVSADLVAGIPNIEVKIGNDTSYPNYIISKNNLLFNSDSITGRIFKQKALGIAMMADFKNIENSYPDQLIQLFNENWNNTSLEFDDFAEEVYKEN